MHLKVDHDVTNTQRLSASISVHLGSLNQRPGLFSALTISNVSTHTQHVDLQIDLTAEDDAKNTREVFIVYLRLFGLTERTTWALFLRMIVYLVIYDFEYVSLEYLPLSWYPSQKGPTTMWSLDA